MNNYKQLAIRYLKMNKLRSNITILGVMVGTMVLYLILNLGWSSLLHERKMIREDRDYEIVLFTETSEQIDKIMKDDKVKNAKAGVYHDTDYYNPKKYDNALYINTTNPYRIDSYFQYFKNTYQVEGCLNSDLAYTYMQGNDYNETFIMVLSVLLLSFIFAIFCVGIVRSSIQMSTLEQIKDYGNLRCIGASKGQLKRLIYVEGAVLEIIGMIFGVIAASFISILIGYKLEWEAGFHVVPLIPIIIAFLGDWYFAMEENCKVVTELTPVSAIRGEYRIRKEKIKVRKKNIFGKLFGIEGDYAYKSIMRNSSRFYKTVWGLGICIASFMAVTGCITSLWSVQKDEEKRYQYYQVFFESPYFPQNSINDVQSKLPPVEILNNIGEMKGMTEAKRIYSSPVFLNDREDFYSRFSEDVLEFGGKEAHDKYGDNEDFSIHAYGEINCYGYDKTDFLRYKSVLTDGTLDISENGIVIVNGGETLVDDGQYLSSYYKYITYTNYKVGDTIDIVDMGKYRKLYQDKNKAILEEYEKKRKELEESRNTEMEDDEEFQNALGKLEDEYLGDKLWTCAKECYKQLLAEGAYHTYTVEGIVSEDANRMIDEFHIIVPMEQYYKITGTDESMSTGMMYHFDEFSTNEYCEALYAGGDYELDCWESGYPWVTSYFDEMKYMNYGIMAVILFIITMTTFNVINTMIGNLHLRRKELAQLRVIGVSKGGLMKIVMLEGVIESIVANGIGVVLGMFLSWGFFYLTLSITYGIQYKFPLVPMLAGLVISTCILCGSSFFALKNLKQDVAADLATGGD